MTIHDSLLNRVERLAKHIGRTDEIVAGLQQREYDLRHARDGAVRELQQVKADRDDIESKRKVLHEASDVYVELVRLRAFAGKARETISPTMNYCDVEFLLSALAELDAGPSEPTQVAEPLDPDTRDQELERLYSAIDGDLLAEGISHVCREIGEARKHGADSEPSPVAEPLDAEGGA